jgi:hypothetical protein
VHVRTYSQLDFVEAATLQTSILSIIHTHWIRVEGYHPGCTVDGCCSLNVAYHNIKHRVGTAHCIEAFPNDSL